METGTREGISRIGVSLEPELLDAFDAYIACRHYLYDPRRTIREPLCGTPERTGRRWDRNSHLVYYHLTLTSRMNSTSSARTPQRCSLPRSPQRPRLPGGNHRAEQTWRIWPPAHRASRVKKPAVCTVAAPNDVTPLRTTGSATAPRAPVARGWSDNHDLQ